MLMILTCSQCNADGMLPITITVNRYQRCGECGHDKDTPMRYYFCSTECAHAWTTRALAKQGVPCLDCRETGFMFGIKQNGMCETCKGTKVASVGYEEEKENPKA